MNDIIKLEPTAERILCISTLLIAAGVKVKHHAVIQLVRQYLDDLQEFGRVAFEMRPFATAGGTQKREIALLNEDQALLLFTYLRNTREARETKIKIIKAFRACRDELQQLKALDGTFNKLREYIKYAEIYERGKLIASSAGKHLVTWRDMKRPLDDKIQLMVDELNPCLPFPIEQLKTE